MARAFYRATVLIESASGELADDPDYLEEAIYVGIHNDDEDYAVLDVKLERGSVVEPSDYVFTPDVKE